MPSLPRCLLLSRPDRIGDVVITSSCLQPVRDQLGPDGKLFLLIQSQLAGLFENHPALDGTLVIDGTTTAEELAAHFQRHRFDAVAHLHESPIVVGAAALAKISSQISLGLAMPSDPANLRRLPINKKQGLCHEAEYNFRILEALGFKAPTAPLIPQLAPTPQANAELIQIAPTLFANGTTLPFVVFHCGAHGKKMRLPSEVFLQAARAVSGQLPTTPVVVIGDSQVDSNADSFINSALLEKISILDLRDKCSLAATAWLLKSAALCLSRDSGPAHLAAAMGCPTLTVFIENTPVMGPMRWHPLGKNSHSIVTPAKPRWWEPWPLYRRRAVRAINADDVSEKLIRLLKATGNAAAQ